MVQVIRLVVVIVVVVVVVDDGVGVGGEERSLEVLGSFVASFDLSGAKILPCVFTLILYRLRL